MVFRIIYDYFRYQVIHFGLINTPTSFQGHIKIILTRKLDVFIIIYLDDILIYIKKARFYSVTF